MWFMFYFNYMIRVEHLGFAVLYEEDREDPEQDKTRHEVCFVEMCPVLVQKNTGSEKKLALRDVVCKTIDLRLKIKGHFLPWRNLSKVLQT